MKHLALFVAVGLAASPALAQDATPTQGPEHPWSLGAGLGVGGDYSLLASLGGLLSNTSVSTPTANVSVERKLTPRTSVLVGLTATANSNTNSPVNQTGGFTSSTTLSNQSFALGVGLRQVLMGNEAVVAISGHAVVSYGYSRLEQSSSVSNGTTTTNSDTVSNGGTLGLGAGIAAERLLTDQLSLRLSLGILRAGYSSGRTAQSGVGSPQNFSGFNLGLQVSPSLELRLYF
jgi:hypothetical protein